MVVGLPGLCLMAEILTQFIHVYTMIHWDSYDFSIPSFQQGSLNFPYSEGSKHANTYGKVNSRNFPQNNIQWGSPDFYPTVMWVGILNFEDHPI